MRVLNLMLVGVLLVVVGLPLRRSRAATSPCLLADGAPARQGLHAVYLKDEHRLCLQDGRHTVWSSVASHGRKAGQKHFEGDERTPEGAYTLSPARASRRFGAFLALSYPNADDLRYAREHSKRPGGSIGIHGPQVWYAFLGSWQALVDHSDGCLVLDERGVAELAARVSAPLPIDILK